MGRTRHKVEYKVSGRRSEAWNGGQDKVAVPNMQLIRCCTLKSDGAGRNLNASDDRGRDSSNAGEGGAHFGVTSQWCGPLNITRGDSYDYSHANNNESYVMRIMRCEPYRNHAGFVRDSV